jgi:hypothetical protein
LISVIDGPAIRRLELITPMTSTPLASSRLSHRTKRLLHQRAVTALAPRQSREKQRRLQIPELKSQIPKLVKQAYEPVPRILAIESVGRQLDECRPLAQA